ALSCGSRLASRLSVDYSLVRCSRFIRRRSSISFWIDWLRSFLAPKLPKKMPAVLLRLKRHERFCSCHSATNRDGIADCRNRSRRSRRLSATANGAVAAGGFPNHQRVGNTAGGESRHHGQLGRGALGEAIGSV